MRVRDVGFFFVVFLVEEGEGCFFVFFPAISLLGGLAPALLG